MNHYPPKFLNEGLKTTAYYCMNDPDSLVIFVHGFKGTSIATWNNFSMITETENKLAKSDIIFYGYTSVKGQAFDQSGEFYNFLKKYATATKIPLRNNSFAYERIIIVAHSLGAIVARYALISAVKDNQPWKRKCSLLLFAPAHSGARLQNLVMLSLPGYLKIAGGLGLFWSPVLDDLRPNSNCLNDLKEETMKFKGTSDESILTAYVLQAYGDKVVHNAHFCYDKFLPPNPVKGQSHVSICKPNQSDYTIPLDELLNFLQ